MYNVFLLSTCNLRCGYCFADEVMGRAPSQGNAPGDAASMMSIEDYERILDFLEASQIGIVSLIGGEPTLHPDFFNIVELSLERGFSVSIKSNAVWKEDVRREIDLLPDEGVHFLLNINQPAALGTRLWQRVARDVAQLKGRSLDFQFNIDRADFEYQTILELASEVGPGKIVWSLSNLVKGTASGSFADPLAVREKYSERLLAFIREAGKRGVKTLGVHGITSCMFAEQDYRELLANGGRLESTCTPVFDILPDLSVLFCFPMSGYWGKKYIYDYSSLQELNMEFQETLAFMRSDLYPLAECHECEYARQEICHGGCIAQHLDGNQTPALIENHFFDHIPFLSKHFRVLKKSLNGNAQPKEVCFLDDMRSGKQYEIDRMLYSLLNSMDGQKSFADLYHEVFLRFEENTAVESIYQDVITQLINRGVLVLKPLRKHDARIAAPHPKA